jgi:hypothetical protein
MPRINTPSESILIVLAATSFLLLANCSSISNQGTTSAGRSPTFSSSPLKSGFGALYIGRPYTSHTSIFALPIELDGTPVVSLSPNQFTRIQLSPGQHEIVVPSTTWNRAISGQPHPANIRVEAGKVYYLLPTRWFGEPETSIIMIGNAVVPERTVASHSSFSVQANSPDAPPPAEFLNLTFVEPTR